MLVRGRRSCKAIALIVGRICVHSFLNTTVLLYFFENNLRVKRNKTYLLKSAFIKAFCLGTRRELYKEIKEIGLVNVTCAIEYLFS